MKAVAQQLLVALLAAGASAGVLAWLLRHAGTRFLPDKANQRSLHRGVIPRYGGLGILFGLVIGIAASAVWVSSPLSLLPSGWWGPLALALALALLDDWRGLPWYLRFTVQSAAIAWLLSLFDLSHLAGGALSVALIAAGYLLIIQWSSNLFNFMDGMDGLAGSMGVVGFTALWLGTSATDTLPLLLAASCLGFLLFNLHPARVFMGDSGSTTLGLLAGALGILGCNKGLWNWPFPVLVFLPFVYDSSSTLCLRLLAKKRVWEAHREHMYQRAVLGGSRVPAVWAAGATLMVVCAACGLAVKDRPLNDQIYVLAALTCLLVGIQVLLYRQSNTSRP